MITLVRHLWPHKTNKYRPGILRLPGLMLVAAFLLITFVVPATPGTRGSVLGTSSITGGELLDQTNQNRQANGLPSLRLSGSLTTAATNKANHMLANNYWAHVSPDGVTAWYFIQQAGYAYDKAGENLAYGFTTTSGVVSGWMNSASHRSNILSSEYLDVGFGIATGDYQGGENTIVVAMYGKPVPAISPTPASPAPTASKLQAEVAPATTPEPVPGQETLIESIPPENEESQSTSQPPSGFSAGSEKRISLFAALRLADTPWTAYAAAALLGYLCFTYAFLHIRYIHKVVIRGEKILNKHPLLEAGLVYATTLFVFTGTYGVIQ